MTLPVPFLPAPYEEDQLKAGQFDLKQWRIEYEQAHPAPPIENVRYAHNPNWRNEPQFWSLQGVRDHPNLFWKIIGFLFLLSQASWFVMGLRGIW